MIDTSTWDLATVGAMTVAAISMAGTLFAGTIKFAFPILQQWLSRRFEAIDSPQEEKTARYPPNRRATHPEDLSGAIRGIERIEHGQALANDQLKRLTARMDEFATSIRDVEKAHAETRQDVAFLKGRMHGQ